MGSTWLTAGILLGITILFISLFSLAHKRARKKKQEKQKLLFQELINLHQLTITEQEEFAHHTLAIDTVHQKLVSIEFEENRNQVQIIDLQNVKSADVSVVENTVYEDGKKSSSDTHISKIQLVFSPRDSHHPKQFLTFYQDILNGMGEMQLLKSRAEHWKQVVNQYLLQPKNYRMDVVKNKT